MRALAASSDDDAGRAELLKAARVCVEADAAVCDGKVLAAVLASLQKCGPRSRRAAHEALGAVFASGRCDLEEAQAREVCRAACAALDAPVLIHPWDMDNLGGRLEQYMMGWTVVRSREI